MNNDDIDPIWKEKFQLKLTELLQGSKPRIENITLMKIFYGSGYADCQSTLSCIVDEALKAVDLMIIDRDVFHNENEELKRQNKGFQEQYNTDGELVNSLRNNIESMKCCGNCKEWTNMGGRSFCGLSMIGVINICDNWIRNK